VSEIPALLTIDPHPVKKPSDVTPGDRVLL